MLLLSPAFAVADQHEFPRSSLIHNASFRALSLFSPQNRDPSAGFPDPVFTAPDPVAPTSRNPESPNRRLQGLPELDLLIRAAELLGPAAQAKPRVFFPPGRAARASEPLDLSGKVANGWGKGAAEF